MNDYYYYHCYSLAQSKYDVSVASRQLQHPPSMNSGLRLKPCARPACHARRNQSSTGSCCDGYSVSFFVPRLATNGTQRSVSTPLRKPRLRRMPTSLVMTPDQLLAQEYSILWHNGRLLLSEQNVSVRKCSIWDCLLAVPHRLPSCPQCLTRQ